MEGNESTPLPTSFGLNPYWKKEDMREAREEGKKTGTIRWKDKEREIGSPDGTAALFPAITRPRNPEDIIISFPVSRYPPSSFPVYEFEGNAKLAHRIYFIKPFSKLPLAVKLSLQDKR